MSQSRSADAARRVAYARGAAPAELARGTGGELG